MTDAPAPAPRIAVVTVSYASAGVLDAFLRSVAEASESFVPVVVADNLAGSRESVEAQVLSYGALYIAMPDNRGYGGAANRAAADLSDSVEWILVSNPDVVLHAGSIDVLLATAQSDPKIGAVGPAILTSAGEVYPSARQVPSLGTGIGHALFANLWEANPWSAAYRGIETGSDVARDAGWLSGACLLVRRSLFDKLGGFDKAYFMYFEDVDLGWRIGRAGYRNVFEPEATVTHSGAHSTSQSSRAMVRAHHASARRFLDVRYAGMRFLPVRTALRVGLWIRGRLVYSRLG